MHAKVSGFTAVSMKMSLQYFKNKLPMWESMNDNEKRWNGLKDKE